MVTKKLDMTPGYIIDYIEVRCHITISYSKASTEENIWRFGIVV